MQAIRYIIVKRYYDNAGDEVLEYGCEFIDNYKAQEMIDMINSINIMAGFEPDELYVDMKLINC